MERGGGSLFACSWAFRGRLDGDGGGVEGAEGRVLCLLCWVFCFLYYTMCFLFYAVCCVLCGMCAVI